MKTFLAAVCLFLAPTLNAQKLQNYSGNWLFDHNRMETKTTLVKVPPKNAPEIPAPPPLSQTETVEVIRLIDNMLRISGGEVGTKTVSRIDPSGKPVSDTVGDMPGVVRIANSHWDNGKLVTDWRMERGGVMLIYGTDVRSLTPDGQQIVTRVVDTPGLRFEVRYALERVR